VVEITPQWNSVLRVNKGDLGKKGTFTQGRPKPFRQPGKRGKNQRGFRGEGKALTKRKKKPNSTNQKEQDLLKWEEQYLNSRALGRE